MGSWFEGRSKLPLKEDRGGWQDQSSVSTDFIQFPDHNGSIPFALKVLYSGFIGRTGQKKNYTSFETFANLFLYSIGVSPVIFLNVSLNAFVSV